MACSGRGSAGRGGGEAEEDDQVIASLAQSVEIGVDDGFQLAEELVLPLLLLFCPRHNKVCVHGQIKEGAVRFRVEASVCVFYQGKAVPVCLDFMVLQKAGGLFGFFHQGTPFRVQLLQSAFQGGVERQHDPFHFFI